MLAMGNDSKLMKFGDYFPQFSSDHLTSLLEEYRLMVESYAGGSVSFW
jgi:hypothetical protein